MVEWKKLGEIGSFIRGNGIQKKDFIEDGYDCIHYGQIHTHYGISATETISKIGATLYNKCKKAKKGDVILATTSEDAEGVAKPVVWLGDTDVAVSGDAFIFHHNQDGKYMAYHFLTDRFTQFKIKNATGAKVVRISGESMAKFEVPIPSLSVQKRIVGMLDTFTSSIDNLKEQIAQRRKQYEYYRDQLLDLEGKEGVEMKTLGEICDFVRGPFGGALKKEIFVKEGYAVYEQQHAIYGQWSFRYYIDEKKYLEMKRFEVLPGDILMSCSGTMGKTSIVPTNCVKGIINQALLKLTAKRGINNHFLKSFMDSQWFQNGLKKQTAGGAIQNVASVSVLKELIVPVPSLSEQQRIVDILDKFEASIQNLEAQLSQREKQYEYYRNKLLTFE